DQRAAPDRAGVGRAPRAVPAHALRGGRGRAVPPLLYGVQGGHRRRRAHAGAAVAVRGGAADHRERAADPRRLRAGVDGAPRRGGSLVKPTPWPSNAVLDDRGLSVAGLPAADLAARYGTPLLVVDEGDFAARCRSFGHVFPKVYFAVKAFPIRPLIRGAFEAGLGLLAATDGELETCMRAGVPAGAVALHGNNKSDRELGLAVEHEVGVVIADN